MQQRPFFTVVIPLYNRAHAIAETVQSVLDQTYQDFEIIVVDDGSIDGGADAVDRMADPRIRCLRQQNAGANVARNRGIDAARGRFVGLLDSDDRFVPEHLERTAAILAEASGALVFSCIVVDRGNGRSFLKPPRAPRPGEDIGEYLFCSRGFVQTSTVAVATEIARRVRYLDGLASGQDSDFAVRLAAAGVPFRMIETPGAIWTDRFDPKRVSAQRSCEAPRRWSEEHREVLTERAYRGFRGWVLAKALARSGRKQEALALYAEAIRHRCYSPALALRILAQILLSDDSYRRVADRLVSIR